QLVSDRVDLAADVLVFRDEVVDRPGAAEELLPPGPLRVGVELGGVEAADRADHVAERLARRADILVAHAVQHLVRDRRQLLLRARAELDDRLRVAEVELGHALLDVLANIGPGLVVGNDVRFRLRQGGQGRSRLLRQLRGPLFAAFHGLLPVPVPDSNSQPGAMTGAGCDRASSTPATRNATPSARFQSRGVTVAPSSPKWSMTTAVTICATITRTIALPSPIRGATKVIETM